MVFIIFPISFPVQLNSCSNQRRKNLILWHWTFQADISEISRFLLGHIRKNLSVLLYGLLLRSVNLWSFFCIWELPFLKLCWSLLKIYLTKEFFSTPTISCYLHMVSFRLYFTGTRARSNPSHSAGRSASRRVIPATPRRPICQAGLLVPFRGCAARNASGNLRGSGWSRACGRPAAFAG